MDQMRIEFHEEMESLRSDIIRLGAMVCETIGRGTAALLDRDLHESQLLIDGDDVIDDFSLGLEERCCQLLALQAAGIVPGDALAAKVILSGTITRKVTLKGVGATKGAKAAIEAVGGSVAE